LKKTFDQLTTAKYTVKEGETLESIAANNRIDLQKLLELNPEIINPDQIYIGQEILLGTRTQIQSIDSKNNPLKEEIKQKKASTAEKGLSETSFQPEILQRTVKMTTGYDMKNQFEQKKIGPVEVLDIAIANDAIQRKGEKKPYTIKERDGTVKRVELYETLSGAQYLDEGNNQYYLTYDSRDGLYSLGNFAENKDKARFLKPPEGSFLLPVQADGSFSNTQIKLANQNPPLEVISIYGSGFFGDPDSEQAKNSRFNKDGKVPVGYYWDKNSNVDFSSQTHQFNSMTMGYYNILNANGKIETKCLDLRTDPSGKVLTAQERLQKVSELKQNPNISSISLVGFPASGKKEASDGLPQNRSALIFGENDQLLGQVTTPPIGFHDVEIWAKETFGSKVKAVNLDGDFQAKSYVLGGPGQSPVGEEMLLESLNPVLLVKPVDQSRANEIKQQAEINSRTGVDSKRKYQIKEALHQDWIKDATNPRKIARKVGLG